MEKRYQVFVSSTFRDLEEERRVIIQALLGLDCIPSSMELFPAADDDQWTLIKKVIDDCDYYIVVVGGKYGSLGPDGISYTQMEYEYALQVGKPILGFIHKSPGDLPQKNSENSDENKVKLESFCKIIQKKMVKYWTTPTDLAASVVLSLVQLMKSAPATGWVRANELPDSAAQEILRLRKQIEVLERKAGKNSQNIAIENLSQGEDIVSVSYHLFANLKSNHNTVKIPSTIDFTWNQIFFAISPNIMTDSYESVMKDAIDDLVFKNLWRDKNWSKINALIFPPKGANVDDDMFQTIKIQLRALGLIEKSSKNQNAWILTNMGDSTMTSLRAIRKPEAAGTAEAGKTSG